jgi:UDP-N-acetylglucosamine--N-acetylmuramyl-(pentapeptide) pyrophosphoryl-undecaprenol N-acetylglucosamine transferase
MKTICLTGGGTAGHIMPHLALLPNLQKEFDQIHYIGSVNGMEKDLIEAQKNLPYYGISTVKLVRSFTPKNLLIPFYLLKGVFQAKALLKRIRPNIVFSKGGFVSLPVVLAAFLLRIPVVTHESDITVGLANKIIHKFSKVLCVSFEETYLKVKKRCVYTGSPVRAQILEGNKTIIFEKYHLDKNKQTLLFMGGSLGAKAINHALYACLDDLLKEYNVLHLTGKGNLKEQLSNKKNYVALEFTNQIEHLFAAADCVICRAGSNVLFELLSLKKPMLLIPLSKKNSRATKF